MGAGGATWREGGATWGEGGATWREGGAACEDWDSFSSQFDSSGIVGGIVILSLGLNLSFGLNNTVALVFDGTNTGRFLTVRLRLGTLGVELLRLRIKVFDTDGGGGVLGVFGIGLDTPEEGVPTLFGADFDALDPIFLTLDVRLKSRI